MRQCTQKRRCEITIISFSRSICRGGLAVAALIGVTGKPYTSSLSCHSHPIRPFRAPSPRGEGCDTRIPSSKKAAKSYLNALNLNPEPSESLKGAVREMRIHFFTAPLSTMIRCRSTFLLSQRAVFPDGGSFSSVPAGARVQPRLSPTGRVSSPDSRGRCLGS